MSDTKQFLDKAYGLDDAQATQAFYRDWATSYDAEVRANGYASPGRCAEALVALGSDRGASLLDLGCGTGISGEAFRDAGFDVIDGTDFSEEMLAVARGKGVYRMLTPGDLANPIPAAPGQYTMIAAVGVFSPGHAPPEMVDAVLDVLPAGGVFVFTLNDHAIAEEHYAARVAALVTAGRARIVHDSYGDHLPRRGIGSQVLVLRRC